MKKYATLKKELEAVKEEATKNALCKKLDAIINNEAIITTALTVKQMMHILQFAELEKALKNSKYTLIHDANFENSKSQTAVTHIYSYIDTANKRVLHIYSHDEKLDIVISSNKATLEKVDIAKLKSNYTIKQKRDKKERIKETKLASVSFDNMIDAVKYATLILESTAEELQAMIDAQ